MMMMLFYRVLVLFFALFACLIFLFFLFFPPFLFRFFTFFLFVTPRPDPLFCHSSTSPRNHFDSLP